ncbi:uncharacterized protein L3040_006481 [Drepanopeziza brunnea f. sp. 'multigermtubi']|uniref:uncharacterized protein n=1 Tax=Drepanopeziza brunnea f. sp. 'multigermtubi' TaxID=698441 RepID=UPI00238A1F2D|nr:hypothetical protein L3040_006481 [Drepanopeziza brunnea f. sp. 'multigermtubi']
MAENTTTCLTPGMQNHPNHPAFEVPVEVLAARYANRENDIREIDHSTREGQQRWEFLTAAFCRTHHGTCPLDDQRMLMLFQTEQMVLAINDKVGVMPNFSSLVMEAVEDMFLRHQTGEDGRLDLTRCFSSLVRYQLRKIGSERSRPENALPTPPVEPTAVKVYSRGNEGWLVAPVSILADSEGIGITGGQAAGNVMRLYGYAESCLNNGNLFAFPEIPKIEKVKSAVSLWSSSYFTRARNPAPADSNSPYAYI